MKSQKYLSLEDEDIVCGSNITKSNKFKHQGNEHYKSVIQQNRQVFQEAEKDDRSTVIQQVISQFKGRFLKPVEEEGEEIESKWERLSMEDVHEKILKDLLRTPPPTKLYYSLQEHDIICGNTMNKKRFQNRSKHPGNIQYHSLIQQKRHVYQSNSDRDSQNTLVEDIISQLAPARFLLPTARGKDHWQEMSIKKIRQKVHKSLNYPLNAESTAGKSTEAKSSVTSTVDPDTNAVSSSSSSAIAMSRPSPTTKNTTSSSSSTSRSPISKTSPTTGRLTRSKTSPKTKRSSSSYLSLQDNDIICGNVKGIKDHHGNIKYQSLIQQNCRAFRNEPNPESKSTMIALIISQLAPGRFVSPIDRDMNQLVEMPIQEVRKRIRKAMNQQTMNQQTNAESSTPYTLLPDQLVQTSTESSTGPTAHLSLQEYDIICGIMESTDSYQQRKKHPGNIQYLSLIKQHRHAYQTNNDAKPAIIDGVISQLAPARFLIPIDRDKDQWEEMPTQEVRGKIRKALSKPISTESTDSTESSEATEATEATSSNTANVSSSSPSSPSTRSTSISTKIHSLQENDVLIGVGSRSPQNEHFYGTIREFCFEHQECRSKNPSDDSVIHQVIHCIKKKGGRFLCKDEEDGYFKVVEDGLVVEKVNGTLMNCRALRSSKGNKTKEQQNTKHEAYTEDKSTENDDVDQYNNIDDADENDNNLSADKDDNNHGTDEYDSNDDVDDNDNNHDSDIFEGDNQDGKYNGKGKLRRDNFKYEGSFKDNKMHGKGIARQDNGERYEGEFVNDEYNGKGKYFWPDGDYYEGEFKNDTRCGKGKMLTKAGIIYSGVFARDSMNGKGSVKYANGNMWFGDWKNDHPNGVGLSFYSDGIVSKEEFNEEKLNPKEAKARDNTKISSSGSIAIDELADSPDKTSTIAMSEEQRSLDDTSAPKKPDEVKSTSISVCETREKSAVSSSSLSSPDELEDSPDKSSAMDMSDDGSPATIATIATANSPDGFVHSPDYTDTTSVHTKKRKYTENQAEDNTSTTIHGISTTAEYHYSDHSSNSHERDAAIDGVESGMKVNTKRRKKESHKPIASHNFNINSLDYTIEKISVSNNEAHETASEPSRWTNRIIPKSHMLTDMTMHSQQNTITELRRLFNEGKISKEMKHVLQSDAIDCQDGIIHSYKLLHSSDRSEYVHEFIYQCNRRYEELSKRK